MAAPGGWLSAEEFHHAGCGGLQSQPSPAMPPLSRAPPPVWPLVDGGLTSWGPLASGRQSLCGSEARERACTATSMAWGHCLPLEGAMPSHTRSCSHRAAGTLPLSAGGSPAAPSTPDPQGGCGRPCLPLWRGDSSDPWWAAGLAQPLKQRGTCMLRPRRHWVPLVPAPHCKITSYGKLQVVTKIKRITDWREDAGVDRPVLCTLNPSLTHGQSDPLAPACWR